MKKKNAGKVNAVDDAEAAKALMASNIKRAKREMTTAESALETAIGAIKALPRAEKVTASKVVGDAFAQLKLAQKKLDELETLLGKAAKSG